ncbi:MAG: right-handed parallel beta-helix repeat-containing protein [Acidobacteria bacterium]|nr:right-handed parallel beta-helix repeat-containing protein [Acidobacteriota bacterium]
MKNKFFYTTALLLAPATLFANVQCGDAVSGIVNLTADLVCQNKPGLVVAADNTTINLNGFSISCESNGVAGTCQRLLNASGLVQPAQTYMGIVSTGKSNVTIQGPGVIDGFAIGIRIQGGQNLKVDSVKVYGPAQTQAATSQRFLTPGILLVGISCPVATRVSASVTHNTVENQSVGIMLDSASCTTIFSNTVQDNNGRFGDSHGIKLVNSSRNLISLNSLTRNGANRQGGVPDSGINILAGAGDRFSKSGFPRRFCGNKVTSNCGDGIANANGASNNIFELNVARYNGLSQTSQQCMAAAPGVFFDLAERNSGFGNNWNPNNTCRTNSVTIPNGVCNPFE